MSTIISLQTILWSALAAAAGIGLPVLVFLVWKFKFCRGAKLFPAVVGAVTFVVGSFCKREQTKLFVQQMSRDDLAFRQKTLHALQQSGIDGWRPLHTGRTRG